MKKALVVTPVKNSPESTKQTIIAISQSSVPVEHHVYNDFSEAPTKEMLNQCQQTNQCQVIHLEDITDTPSPNYKLVLQLSQKNALDKNLPLIIVESDVTVANDTIEKLLNFSKVHPEAGMIGAITVGASGKVNFPYLKFKNTKKEIIETKRSLSFCCTLLSVAFLKKYDFSGLNNSKDWYDTHISQQSIACGFKNYVLMNTPVHHAPHSSRPWKQLKYENPLKYYFLKYWKGLDKI